MNSAERAAYPFPNRGVPAGLVRRVTGVVGGSTLGDVTEQPAEPRGFRVSDEDRERAAARLQQALSEGRITLSELEERLAAVYAAKYEADLRAPLADLPDPDTSRLPDTTSASLPVPAVEPVVLRTAMSTIKRTGAWDVPPRLRVQTSMGSIVLDFCEAVVRHPVVDIEVDVGAGSVRLLVPEGTTANVDNVVSGMGTVKSTVPSVRRPGALHLHVHGRTAMGSVVVRRPYRIGRFRF